MSKIRWAIIDEPCYEPGSKWWCLDELEYHLIYQINQNHLTNVINLTNQALPTIIKSASRLKTKALQGFSSQ